jgi:hypothetical protein
MPLHSESARTVLRLPRAVGRHVGLDRAALRDRADVVALAARRAPDGLAELGMPERQIVANEPRAPAAGADQAGTLADRAEPALAVATRAAGAAIIR